MTKKHRAFWGVIGVMLVFLGAIWTIALAVSGHYLYGLILSGFSVISGVLLVAWVFGD